MVTSTEIMVALTTFGMTPERFVGICLMLAALVLFGLSMILRDPAE